MITFHHANTSDSRAAKLRIAHLCVLKTIVIHVSCLEPHLTLTTSQSSLSLISSTSPIFPTVSPLDTSPMILGSQTPCDVPRQSAGSTQIPPLTGCEPKSFENKVFDTEAIEPEDLEPRRIELDRNGTDPYPSQERCVRNSITEDMDESGKVGAEMFCFQSQMHSNCDSAESTADPDLEKRETTKNAGFTTENASREDCESYRVPIAPGKPAAFFSIKKRRTRKPIQEFCFQKR